MSSNSSVSALKETCTFVERISWRKSVRCKDLRNDRAQKPAESHGCAEAESGGREIGRLASSGVQETEDQAMDFT